MSSRTSSKPLIVITFVGIFLIFISFFAGLAGAYIGSRFFSTVRIGEAGEVIQPLQVVQEESKIIEVATNSTESVVSIIISKDLPIYENQYYNPFGEDSPFNFQIPGRVQNGTERQEIGAGTGFVISSDGLIITNRHVVSDTTADYTVVFSDGETAEAKVLARDTILDIAILKITVTKELSALPLGNSSQIQIGQTAITIGNSLGEFSNTVSSGIISGLSRDIIASDSSGNGSERLTDVIQTDASINPGNSGGPLLDINGNVIGVNVAVAQDAENIGFAIPIDSVKTIIDSVNEFGEIVRPYLGVRYIPVTEQLKEENGLTVDQGAYIITGGVGEPGIIVDSPADKAGLKVGDVIIKVDAESVTIQNSLQSLIQTKQVGDEVELVIVREGNTLTLIVTLEKLPE